MGPGSRAPGGPEDVHEASRLLMDIFSRSGAPTPTSVSDGVTRLIAHIMRPVDAPTIQFIAAGGDVLCRDLVDNNNLINFNNLPGLSLALRAGLRAHRLELPLAMGRFAAMPTTTFKQWSESNLGVGTEDWTAGMKSALTAYRQPARSLPDFLRGACTEAQWAAHWLLRGMSTSSRSQQSEMLTMLSLQLPADVHGRLAGLLSSGARGFNGLLELLASPLDVAGRLLERRKNELPAAPGCPAGSVAFHPDMQDEALLHFFSTTEAVAPLWKLARYLVTTAYKARNPGGASGERSVDVQAAQLLKDMFARRSEHKFKHLLGPLSMLLKFGGLSMSVMSSLSRMGVCLGADFLRKEIDAVRGIHIDLVRKVLVDSVNVVVLLMDNFVVAQMRSVPTFEGGIVGMSPTLSLLVRDLAGWPRADFQDKWMWDVDPVAERTAVKKLISDAFSGKRLFTDDAVWQRVPRTPKAAAGTTLGEVADEAGVSVNDLLKGNGYLLSTRIADRLRELVALGEEAVITDYTKLDISDLELMLRRRTSITDFTALTQEALNSGRLRDVLKSILKIHQKYLKGVPREDARWLPIILVVDEQEDLIMLILQYRDRRGMLAVFGDLNGDADGANILGNIIVKRPAAFHVIKNGGEIQVALHWNEFYRYVFALHGVKRLTHTDAELAAIDVSNMCDGKNPLKGASKGKTAYQAWGEEGSDSDSEEDDPADDLPQKLQTSWRHHLPAIKEALQEIQAIDGVVALGRVGPGSVLLATLFRVIHHILKPRTHGYMQSNDVASIITDISLCGGCCRGCTRDWIRGRARCRGGWSWDWRGCCWGGGRRRGHGLY